MRRFHFLVIPAVVFTCSIGCHSTSSNPANLTPSNSSEDLAAMKTRYARLREQNLDDCLRGSPEKIKANQELCKRERDELAPLGNAIEAAEVKAAQRATNP